MRKLVVYCERCKWLKGSSCFHEICFEKVIRRDAYSKNTDKKRVRNVYNLNVNNECPYYEKKFWCKRKEEYIFVPDPTDEMAERDDFIISLAKLKEMQKLRKERQQKGKAEAKKQIEETKARIKKTEEENEKSGIIGSRPKGLDLDD